MKATKQEILQNTPTTCPACGGELNLSEDYAHLQCINPYCRGKLARRIDIFVKALGIKHIGISLCNLLSEELTQPSQIVDLDFTTLRQYGLPHGIASRAAKSINTVFLGMQKVNFSNLIQAFSIDRLGQGTARQLAIAFPSVDSLLSASPRAIMHKLPRVGNDAAESIHSGLLLYASDIRYLSNNLDIIYPSDKNPGKFRGKKICITGKLSKPRKKIAALIEAQGGKIVDTVTSTTDFLLCNQSSSSSKYKSATKLGKSIITESDLLNEVNSYTF